MKGQSKKVWAILLAAVGLTGAAEAQTLEWVDTVPMQRGSVEGFELRLQASGMLDEAATTRILQHACDHYAPYAVPLVVERTEVTHPAFVRVTVETENWGLALGMGGHWAEVFDLDETRCELRATASR